MPTVADAIKTPVASADAARQSLGTLTIPSGVKKIKGLWSSCSGPGVTTLEGYSGTIEYTKKGGTGWSSMVLPVDSANWLGTGMGYAKDPRIIPVDLDVSNGDIIEAFVQMGQTLTINPTFLWGYIGE